MISAITFAHENRSEAARKRWEDPEARQKQSAVIKARCNDPTIRAKREAAQRSRWEISGGTCLETREKQRFAANMRWSKPGEREKYSGENHPNWRGGLSFEPYCPKFNRDLKRRIRAFFDYRCVACGKSTVENKIALSCHHVEYNKQACCDGQPVHFAALCVACHSKTSGEDHEQWEAMLHRVLEEIYDGRSYFTKDEWKEIKECQVIT